MRVSSLFPNHEYAPSIKYMKLKYKQYLEKELKMQTVLYF